MLEETGEVREVKPERAVVLIRRSSSCKSCGARGACMTLGTNERTVEVHDPLGVAVGDQVAIGIPPGNVVWASTVAYIFPVVAMLAGALLGTRVAPAGGADSYAALGGFGALALAFVVLSIYDRTRGKGVEKMPVVMKVVTEGTSARSDDVDRGSDVE